MSTEGRAAGNSGDDSVSSAPSRESDKQRAAGPSRGLHFTPGGARKTSKVWFNDREYWVYTHRATDGSVLYVGYTSDRKGRERTHRKGSAWYPLVTETIFEGPFDRGNAQARERELIEQHDPPNNFMHTSRYVHKRSQKAAS